MWKELDKINGRKIKNIYVINENGVVKNKLRDKKLSIRDNGTGYKTVCLVFEDGSNCPIYVHRLVVAHFMDARIKEENNLVVNHLDFNTSNNSVTNLSVCTQKENIHYSINAGRIRNTGENNPTAIFTEQEVMEICETMQSHPDLNYATILKLIGKDDSRSNLDILTKIRTGKIWTHVSKHYNLKQRKRNNMNSFKDKKDLMIDLIKNDRNISYNTIAKKLNIDISSKNERDKLYNIVRRLKNKLT